ncbi:MAG: amino acid transporter [Firmicutes bacterium]|nr:amino acid transporter [Bacillota bacterium]
MAFLHGFILALGLILPLGPQNTLIFNQGAVQPKFLNALPVVIAAGICDTLLILLAVSGVSVVIFKFSAVTYLVLVVGIIFLIYMGILTWKSTSAETNHFNNVFTIKKQILFASSVSIFNPHAVMDIIGVIGISSLQYSGIDKIVFTSATILVSFAWFFFLVLLGRVIRNLGNKTLVVFNRISAIIMWGSAFYLFLNFLK